MPAGRKGPSRSESREGMPVPMSAAQGVEADLLELVVPPASGLAASALALARSIDDSALARCEAFVQALAADLEAIQERSAEYREMAGDLSRVRIDEKRAQENRQREDVLLAEVSPGDLGGAESEIRKTRERLERLLRNQADKTTPSPRVIRSAASSPTG